MVRALLDGQKTQTRRVVKEPPGWNPHEMPLQTVAQHPEIERAQAFFGDGFGIGCPYGKPGDRLWVRETWTLTNHGTPVYRADCRDKTGQHWPSIAEDPAGVRWRPSIHMPRSASRIALDVKAVRVERVQGISDADAEAEGACHWFRSSEGAAFLKTLGFAVPDRPRFLFELLWKRINGAESWQQNPWVWVVSFAVSGRTA